MTIKTLSEVMRNPKLYAQTKALYTYLYIRADYKRSLAYPPKKQIKEELNLTDKMLDEGLSVLSKFKYIEIGTEQGTDKTTSKPYTYTTYKIMDKTPQTETIPDKTE